MVLRFRRLVLVTSLLAFSAGCEIEWGGATVHLEDPSPPPEEPAATETAAEQVELPLPEGPLVWVVRTTGNAGEVLAMPVARLEGGVPVDLEYPEPPPEGYRERFDAAFASEATELVLGASAPASAHWSWPDRRACWMPAVRRWCRRRPSCCLEPPSRPCLSGSDRMSRWGLSEPLQAPPSTTGSERSVPSSPSSSSGKAERTVPSSPSGLISWPCHGRETNVRRWRQPT